MCSAHRIPRPEVRQIVVAAVVVAAVLLPFAMSPGATFLEDGTVALAYTVMALGLNVVVGFAGLLDLGYVAFFAFGAYAAAWLGSGFFNGRSIHIGVAEHLEHLPGIHVNWLLIVIVAATLAAVGGAVIGIPTLRLRGDYIAMATLAFGEIIGRTAVNGGDGLFGIGHFNLTNGRRGINPVDKVDLPFLPPFTTVGLRAWYWLALFLVVAFALVSVRLRNSRIGRAWLAVRENELVALSLGVPTWKVKLLAYATGAAIGGVAGSFLAAFYEQVNAGQFEFSFSIFVLAMVVLGGLGSVRGVVFGAIALSFIERRLFPDVINELPSKIGLDFDMTQFGFGTFGFVLVIMMLLRPQGLIPERRRA